MDEIGRIALELEHGSDPITGVLQCEAGPPRPFAGYLELIAALEAARRPPAAAAPGPDPATGPGRGRA